MILNANVKYGLLAALLAASSIPNSYAFELSGYVAGEYRYFQHKALNDDGQQHQGSLIVAPEWFYEWDDGQFSLLFSPYLRLDEQDAERSHADIRELQWLWVKDDWELRLGIGKVFWGVTESQHLVDVINQTDLVDNIDTEDKLGQPMVNLSLYQDWGTVDVFVLPYFRERTYPGVDGRLRAHLPIDTDTARYESGAGRHHMDWAIRWSHSMGNWDWGVSHFYGTNREPTLLLNDTASALIPYYHLMHQTGVDLQYTVDAWLWKWESIRRETKEQTFFAATGGVEYTFYGVFESDMDVGIIAEYLFDDRDDSQLVAFEDDILIGARLTWNDVQSTELLIGMTQDLTTEDTGWRVEASRRIGERWTVSLEGQFFSIDQKQSVLYPLRQDDFLQLEIARYF